jgi:hypothetical protein
LVPTRLKERAYADFAINHASALIAHFSVGGGYRRAWASYSFCRRLHATLASA